MSRVIISEGKTTNEAIENGLKELNVSKNQVDIKVLEQEKKSFFSILAPRIVKVELTVRDEEKEEIKIEKKVQKEISSEDIETIKNNIDNFLKSFLALINPEFEYKIIVEESNINIEIDGNDSGVLIGYRGETLNALQSIITSVANKNTNSRAKIFLNIDSYKEKRKKALEELALKVSKTVLKTGKNITLEPMNAFERKVIHTKLQDMNNIKTHSVGEEPNRRIVIEKIK